MGGFWSVAGKERRACMKRIIIVDYGLGNLRSVYKGLEKAGGNPHISSLPDELRSADGIVLPGVGAFHEGMEQLGLLQQAIIDSAGNIPILGICLGMQMLLQESEEHGLHAGLGIVPGRVRRFPQCPGYKIPHMGWNSIYLEDAEDPLVEGCAIEEFVYFVHSYYVDTSPEFTLTTTKYICPFASTVRNGTTYGVQFHPEKSGQIGLHLLANFIAMI